MAKYAAMCQETGTGTNGNITLAGAVSGFRAFNDPSHIATNDHILVTIVDGDLSGAYETVFCKLVYVPNFPDVPYWELQRVQIVESSNSDATVTFSGSTHTISMAPTPPLFSKKIHCKRALDTPHTIHTGFAVTCEYSATFSPDTGNFAAADTGWSYDFVVPEYADIVLVTYSLEFTTGATDGHVITRFYSSGGDSYSGIRRTIFLDGSQGEFVDGYQAIIRRNPGSNLIIRSSVENQSGATISQASSGYIAIEVLG